MKKKPLAFVVLMMASTPVWAGWQHFHGEGATEWQLEAPASGSGSDIRWVWAVSSFEKPNEQGYLSQKGLLGFDCQRRRFHRSVPLLLFREKRGEGVALAGYRDDWLHPPSPRVRQEMASAVCASTS